jgi:hypothetical protein
MNTHRDDPSHTRNEFFNNNKSFLKNGQNESKDRIVNYSINNTAKLIN